MSEHSIAPGSAGSRLPYSLIDSEPSDQPVFISELGTPIYSALEFLAVSGTSLDNSVGIAGGRDVLMRLDTILTTVSKHKNIIKTAIPGRDGTVKEWVGSDDYEITFIGAIVSPHPNRYPKEDVSLLEEILRLKKPLPVASTFLALFKTDENHTIESIVVQEYTISEKLGSRNEVLFEFTAISDRSELTIKEMSPTRI